MVTRMWQETRWSIIQTTISNKDKRIYSLRSQGENGVDVSMIASKFGGGGHRNAAGFSIEKPQIDLNQYI